MNTEIDNIKTFAAEYVALCRKYHLSVKGCGHCGSPWLEDTKGVKLLKDFDLEGAEKIVAGKFDFMGSKTLKEC
jgi:hypothetical protein